MTARSSVLNIYYLIKLRMVTVALLGHVEAAPTLISAIVNLEIHVVDLSHAVSPRFE